MKIVIIGSGMAGLTCGAYLSRAGHRVTILEQFPVIGGVAATVRQNGFGWDLGPLLLDGFLPGEPAHEILVDLGVADDLPVTRRDRGISFPDFDLRCAEEYRGPLWRRDRLKEIFPDEAENLDRYYHFYEQVLDLVRYHNLADRTRGLAALFAKMKLWRAYRRVKEREPWSAEELMDHFFTDRRLKAVFTGILADFVVRPSEFPALGVPLSNIETAFDVRIPVTHRGADAPVPAYAFILGGCGRLVETMAGLIESTGGDIRTSSPVEKIVIENNRAVGVRLEGGEVVASDLVIATGGARETFFDLVGRNQLSSDVISHVEKLIPMQSVLMVHLGVDFDPREYQDPALWYYYNTYDIEGAVKECQRGKYHGGKDGFLIYVPSFHSPELARPNHHAVTVYTIAPNTLERGTWEERKEEFADTLINEAEKIVPGLRKGTVERMVLAPDDFRKRVHQGHHSFGGLPPVMGQVAPPHKTSVEGLWFIGSQSESGGGVRGVMVGARNVARKIIRKTG
ncbi:MAG: NAD(P)/FAD-dependent oxidoreductase [Deltaproteobacteria bacterium]|nr:NAD(P)/FAD-dependent oxidoreductase [Candidatus Zymogenaceae bacterium]